MRNRKLHISNISIGAFPIEIKLPDNTYQMNNSNAKKESHTKADSVIDLTQSGYTSLYRRYSKWENQFSL